MATPRQDLPKHGVVREQKEDRPVDAGESRNKERDSQTAFVKPVTIISSEISKETAAPKLDETQDKNRRLEDEVAESSAPKTVSPNKSDFFPATPDLTKVKDAQALTSSPGLAASPQTTSSRPETPTTTTSEVSKTSARRPLTIRVTTNTTRPAESVPPSAATERSIHLPTVTQAKQITRTNSIVSPSQSRPSTPAASDRFSADVSRASSPPPSVVGSAPERTKTKAQQKKERKEKAKKQVDTPEAAAPPAPVVEEVGPVVGRQRKQKKLKDETSKVKTQPVKDKKPVEPDEEALSTQDSIKEMEDTGPDNDTVFEIGTPTIPATAETAESSPAQTPQLPKQSSFTIGDLFLEVDKRVRENPKASESAVMLQVASEHLRPFSQILGEMFEAGDIDPKKSTLFNPSSMSSNQFKLPPDGRKGQDYLARNQYTDSSPFGITYLGSEHKAALRNRQDVNNFDANRPDDLLHRTLITGWGTIFRHLSEEEEQQAVVLEEKKEEWQTEWGEDHMGIGLMNRLDRLEPDDYNNIAGDVTDLLKQGQKYGIGWVKALPGSHTDTDAPDAADSEDEAPIQPWIAAARKKEIIERDRNAKPEEMVTETYTLADLEAADAEADRTAADQDTESLSDPDDDDEDEEDDEGRTDDWADMAPIFGIDTHIPTAYNHSAAHARLAAAAEAHVTKQMGSNVPGTAGYAFDPKVATRYMSVEQLKAREEECLREMEAAKKEMERVERLVRNNQRDVQRFLGKVPVYSKG